MFSMAIPPSSAASLRLRVAVRGAVQGVGFRPFVFRLAESLQLKGWVNNSTQGVFIEAEGPRPALEEFLLRLDSEQPPQSFIQSLEASWLDPAGLGPFEIRPSLEGGSKVALVMPDIATCPDCLREIFDPADRRFRYPFTNCTHCGPRFSIVEALPYDRAHTTMKAFAQCPDCQSEYERPQDRRFHAQPNACPACGPRLAWIEGTSRKPLEGDPLRGVAEALRSGKIVAVKGVGGFHLMVDARNEEAVSRLRLKKQREAKPLALLFPNLAQVQLICEVSTLEERLLRSPEAPIVLLRKRADGPTEIAPSVAPENPYLGVMLPSNPLHHLLLAELGFPVVATSGNLSDEPICTDETDALDRLGGIADFFLIHNRPIVRHLDDSIVRVMLGREMVLRRARGYAPLPLRGASGATVLAVGAHLKNSVALAVGENVFLSQHIGDLSTEPATQAFRRVAADLPQLYEARPEIVAADLHPDYLSTQYAESLSRVGAKRGPARLGVQHHVAHVLSCIAENETPLPALGVAWDGTGYGPDGTIWGGEFFRVAASGVERVAKLRPFPLPGGDKAVKEPRRAALGLLYELYGESVFEMTHLALLRQMPAIELITLKGMLQRKFNSPRTSSIGRLFDVVASLANLRQIMQFEGQAAMELEFALPENPEATGYAFQLLPQNPQSPKPGAQNPEPRAPFLIDWSRVISCVLADVNNRVPVAEISARFHQALVELVVAVAQKTGERRVVLSGGCFQNRHLTERAVTRLRAEGFQPYWHQRVPPNDGGIALGQVYAARHQLSLK